MKCSRTASRVRCEGFSTFQGVLVAWSNKATSTLWNVAKHSHLDAVVCPTTFHCIPSLT